MKIILKVFSGDNLPKNRSTMKNNEFTNSSSNEMMIIENQNNNNYSDTNNKINDDKNIYDDDPMDIITNCDKINEINANHNLNDENSNFNNLENNDKNFNSHNSNDTKDIIKIINNERKMISSKDSIIEYQNLINNSKKDQMKVMEVECNIVESSQHNKMRIALGILIRLILPFYNGVARGWKGIRGVRLLKILKQLGASRHMLTNMLAYAVNTISMGLSSVQVVHRIDPILKIMKLRKNPSTIKSITAPSSSTLSSSSIISPKLRVPALTLNDISLDEPEKCVTIEILAEPPPGTPIRADIVFIHGLHGSLVKTWKQGLWNSEGRKEDFKRPPKPPLRPPKRPRHSRSSIFIPPQLRKRPRYDNNNSSSFHNSYHSDSELYDDNHEENQTKLRQYSYDCGRPGIVNNYDGMEFNFPTFRLRREEEYYNDSSNSSSRTTSTCTTPTSEKSSKFYEQMVSDDNNNNNKKVIDEENNYSKCWPSDWLPLDCPGIRVIALNYTTDPYLWRPVWMRKCKRSSLIERAREMTELLIEKRVGCGQPIIWVGHSKGGIFIKQIIVDAWENGRLSATPLWRSSRGVFFYSVPHRGSPLADFNLPFLRQSIELIELQKDSPYILDLHRRFVALYQSGNLKIDVFSFVETALTLLSVLYLRIVGVDSADPGIGEVCGVHLDHREICKPRNRNCKLYTELVKMINRVS